jgi:serine/threonine protein kinase
MHIAPEPVCGASLPQIQLREVFETRTEVQLILELVTGGELFERIVERGHYSEHVAAETVREILSALQVGLSYYCSGRWVD